MLSLPASEDRTDKVGDLRDLAMQTRNAHDDTPLDNH